MSEAATQKQDEKAQKTVKIKLLRDASVGGEIRLAGNIVNATEAEAKELCDVGFDGYHPIYGYAPEIGPLMNEDNGGAPMHNPIARKKIFRAIRVK